MKQSTKERIQAYAFMAVLFLMSGWSWWSYENNDYMTYRDVPVTFVERQATNSCHKGSCHDYLEGLFRTDDGMFFSRPISLYMYKQMHLGERFSLNLRPFDMRQTERDNLIWMFGTLAVYIVTAFLWAFALLYLYFSLYEYVKRRRWI